ncbi:MAG: hypothetical protein PHY99_11045, partial [Bacteroidales bacterium]|nr:hypothetical protein [Bacteroidales bacterium]
MKKIRLISTLVLLCLSNLVFGFQPKPENDQKYGTIAEPSKLLNGQKAVAQWIWANGEENPKNQYLLIRKSVVLNQVPDSLSAYISAY